MYARFPLVYVIITRLSFGITLNVLKRHRTYNSEIQKTDHAKFVVLLVIYPSYQIPYSYLVLVVSGCETKL
jgi:hypothetical protein